MDRFEKTQSDLRYPSIPGTNSAHRLMRMGTTKAINGGHRIVKAEWDLADAWLKANVDGK